MASPVCAGIARRGPRVPAQRLGRFFGTSPQFWLNLQTLYELRMAEQKTGDTIRTLPTLTARGRKSDDVQPQPR